MSKQTDPRPITATFKRLEYGYDALDALARPVDKLIDLLEETQRAAKKVGFTDLELVIVPLGWAEDGEFDVRIDGTRLETVEEVEKRVKKARQKCARAAKRRKK